MKSPDLYSPRPGTGRRARSQRKWSDSDALFCECPALTPSILPARRRAITCVGAAPVRDESAAALAFAACALATGMATKMCAAAVLRAEARVGTDARRQ